MPFWLHIILVVIITAYFVFRFVKTRQIYEMLFIIWVPSTLLQYVSNDVTFLRIVGISQIILFILVVFFMFRRRNANRTKTAKILADYASGDLDKVMKDKNMSAEELNALRAELEREKEDLKKLQAELETAKEKLYTAVENAEQGESSENDTPDSVK